MRAQIQPLRNAVLIFGADPEFRGAEIIKLFAPDIRLGLVLAEKDDFPVCEGSPLGLVFKSGLHLVRDLIGRMDDSDIHRAIDVPAGQEKRFVRLGCGQHTGEEKQSEKNKKRFFHA